MASSEVEKIIEPVSIQEVEGVKSYLTPEVEAAVVSLAKSEEMQQLQHSLPEGGNNSSIIPGVPEGESFLDSSSNGTKVSDQDHCEKEEVITGQADEPITAKSDQVHHESIEGAGLDAVIEDRVSSGIEAGEQISTPEVSLVQNEAAAPETCLENGSKDNGFSSGVEGNELEPTANETEVETGLLEEEKPADSDDVQDKGVILQEKTAESAEEAEICDDKPDEAVTMEAETVVEKTMNSESHEEAIEQKEAASETEKHIESESRELGEPAVAESVTNSAESETDGEKQEQVHEPDSKEAPKLHDAETCKEEVQTEEAVSDATLETKGNDGDIVKKEESSNENATEGDAADDDKVEEPVKEGTIEDFQSDDQSASKEDIATPAEIEVAEKENAEEANETAEIPEAKISDDLPDEAEHIVETEIVEKEPLHSESHEEETDQQNEAPAEVDNHIEIESSIGEPTTAELVTNNGETDAEKHQEIVEPGSGKAPKVHDDAGTSKEEEEVEAKEEASDAQNTELETKSNDDDIVKEEETTSTLGVDKPVEAPETTTVSGEDSTIHIVEEEVEVQKEEVSKEDMKGDDAADVTAEEPVKEHTIEEMKIDDQSASKEITEESRKVDSSVEEPEKNEKDPEVTLQTSPEGIEEVELQQKEEGESLAQAKDEKPSVETSEEPAIITPEAKKEEAEIRNKDTTETVDESSPCIEATQDHGIMDSTVQASMEKEEEGSLESEALDLPVESNDNSKGLEEVAEISNKETSKVAEEGEQLVIPEAVSLPEAQVDSSSKLNDDVAEEKTEIPQEDVKEDLSYEHSNREIEQDENAPEAALETSPEGEKIEALPMEETEKVESKNEGIEEEEVHKKTEQAEIVEKAIEVPQVSSEGAEMVQEGTGELTTPETDQKPSLESSEGVGVSPLAASPEEEKDETEASNKPTAEPDAIVPTSVEKEEGSTETEAPGLEEAAEIKNEEASEIGAVQDEVEKLVAPSTKLDDVVEENAEVPEEDSKEELLNESRAIDSIEQITVEDLQKGEENVEVSVLEESETAAKVESTSTPQETEQDDEVVNGAATAIEAEPSIEEKREEHGSSITPVEDCDNKAEVAETDDSIEKEASEGKEVESVLQEQETATAEELVTEHEIATKDELTEASREITTEFEKAEVQQKEEVPEIIQAADDINELEKTMEDKEELPEEMPEPVQQKTELEPVLGEGEKASVEPEVDSTQEVIEEVKESIPSSVETDKATDSNEQTEAVAAIIQDAPTLDKETLVEATTEDDNAMVGGIEKPLAASAAAPTEVSEETSREEIIEEHHEEKQQPSDAVVECIIPLAGILESAIMQEEEMEGNVESVVAESEVIPDQPQEEKHVVQPSEIPSHEADYETKAVVENTEEEKPEDVVVVSEPDTLDHPLEVQTADETSLKEVQPRELEFDASIANKPVEEHDKEEGASLTVEEDIKEASEGVEATTEDKLADDKSVEEVKAEEQHEAEPPALLTKEEEEKESSTEVFVPYEVDQKQEASDCTGNEAVKDDEVPAVQVVPEEPEVLLDEPKQTEEECKAIQDEVISPAADITEETRAIPEVAVAENMPKQTEEDEVEAPVEQIEKGDDVSEVTTETPDGTAEDKPKQAEEEPVEQQEAGELNVTPQVDPQAEEDVEESDKVQKGDEADVATEETKEVSASITMAEVDEPIQETEEASRPVEQVSREFQVPELEPEVEKGSLQSEESAITEETKTEVSDEVATKPASQETKPLEENEITHPESLPVEKPEEEKPEEAREMKAEASLIKEDPIVEGQEEKEGASELSSNFEFPGFTQPKELEQQVTTECPTGNEESKETAETQEKTVDLSTVTKEEIIESASEGTSQELIAKPEDNEVGEHQEGEHTAEEVIKEKEMIQESKPESEEKAERIPVEESEPKEGQNEDVIHEKESIIPSEGDVKNVEEEEAKVKTEEAKAEATTVIADKELGTEISQRDLPMKLVEEATSEKQLPTEAKPCADDETINPAKLSLFDMMAQSTRERKLVLDPPEETVTGDETKAAEAEPEKVKSDGEKEHDEEEGHDEGEDNHKNDSGSDGLVIVEASKEPEAKVVITTTPQKKSHNILSEVGSKVKHSISKVRKVITGKSSSHQPKQHSPK